MAEISSQPEFEKIFHRVCSEVITEVTLKAYEKLKDVVQREVYDTYKPELYERLGDNGGLKGAWGKDVEIKSRSITGTIEYQPDLMIYNPDKAQHGNYKWGDLREDIAEYIEKGYCRGVEARPFWDIFEKELLNGTLDKWIKQAFKERGFQV